MTSPHGHDHPHPHHHAHGHPPGWPNLSRTPSILRVSSLERMGVSALAIATLWLCVWWALA